MVPAGTTARALTFSLAFPVSHFIFNKLKRFLVFGYPQGRKVFWILIVLG